MNRSLRSALIVVAMTSALSACETARRWERGVLARPEMQLDPNAVYVTGWPGPAMGVCVGVLMLFISRHV